MKIVKGFKLLRVRANGTLGPLFINRKQVIPIGKWLPAEDHPTAGYQHRPGWHAAPRPFAPHLSTRGRVWCQVSLRGVEKIKLPAIQGGWWYLAKEMRVDYVVSIGSTKWAEAVTKQLASEPGSATGNPQAPDPQSEPPAE